MARLTAEAALDRASNSLQGGGSVEVALAFATYAQAVVAVETSEPVEPSEEVERLRTLHEEGLRRVVGAVGILEEAKRRGPRHPAIHEALEVLRGLS